MKQESGIVRVVEPLNRFECNIILSVAEAMEYVKALDHPNLRCLVDSFHLWRDAEPPQTARTLRHRNGCELRGDRR